MKLVIDRLRWARGGRNGSAQLLNDDGNMCCLGFLAIELGFNRDDIHQRGDFSELTSPELIEQISDMDFNPACYINDAYDRDEPANTGWAEKAISINDYNLDKRPEYARNDIIVTSEESREDQITMLFAEEGIDVTFIN